MSPEPGTPAEWMRYALSDLQVARMARGPGVLLETLCFHAQQAVEKSIKAILIARSIEFSRTHNLKTIVRLLPGDLAIPPDVEKATELSEYAAAARYPAGYEYIGDEDYDEAVRLAEVVVKWAEEILRQGA